MERGERDREHRETGRQRSEPEEGNIPGSQRGGRGEAIAEMSCYRRSTGRRRKQSARQADYATHLFALGSQPSGCGGMLPVPIWLRVVILQWEMGYGSEDRYEQTSREQMEADWRLAIYARDGTTFAHCDNFRSGPKPSQHEHSCFDWVIPGSCSDCGCCLVVQQEIATIRPPSYWKWLARQSENPTGRAKKAARRVGVVTRTVAIQIRLPKGIH